MNDYPRVLIIGQTFDKSGGGITLGNLFKGWPLDKIAVADTSIDGNDRSICNNVYSFGALETSRPWPFSIFQRKVYSGRVNENVELLEGISESNLGNNAVRSSIRKLYLSAQHFTGLFHYINRVMPSEQFLSWIREFNPDLIYTQLASLGCIRIVDWVSKTIQKPIVIHIMDDWPATIVKPGLFSSYWKKVIDQEFRALIQRSVALMSICQAMSEEYESRYGREFHPFHNPIDLSMWQGQSRTTWTVGTPVRILYAGRLGNVNMRSLMDVCNAISDLQSDGQEIVFEIRTPDMYVDNAMVLQKYKGIEINPYIKHSEMPSKLRSVDILIIPLDFNERNLKFTQYSMPGKTSDYMASGTPVLVYAPAGNAVIRYARESEWGYVVDKPGKEHLKRAINELISDLHLREKLGKTGIKLAFQNHDATVVRHDFQNLIRESAGKKNHKRGAFP